MKQNITKEQWNELTENEKYTIDKCYKDSDFKSDDNEIMNEHWDIGRMIEFLKKEDNEIEIEYVRAECFIGWKVIGWEYGQRKCNHCDRDYWERKKFYGESWDELCDALWEAVKYKLKN